ncbi:MAG: hypothetical protein AAF317_09305, partial [Pseudomonadota bacterium]
CRVPVPAGCLNAQVWIRTLRLSDGDDHGRCLIMHTVLLGDHPPAESGANAKISKQEAASTP